MLRKKPSIFGFFFLASVLLHLLLGFLLHSQHFLPEPQNETRKISLNLQERKNWLELDQQPPKKTPRATEEARHLAEANQQVERETSRVGDDSRDKPLREQSRLEKPSTQTVSPPRPAASTDARTVTRSLPTPGPGPPQKVIELPQLTSLAPRTLARLDQQKQAQRSKDRPEIALKDDEIWLNLRQMDNKLLSFFRRFHDRIEAVWNYPVEASSRGIEGTLLVKIVINRKGEMIDAFPLESSGSELLDYEAITAIYRAAPFGPLPSSYQHPQLKIYAHFQYSLRQRMIYGRPY